MRGHAFLTAEGASVAVTFSAGVVVTALTQTASTFHPGRLYSTGMRWFGLAVLVFAGVAHANGRPPLTNGIFFKPGDPHSLYLRTTFGLQISHDDGCTFNWVCEDDVGYGGNFDPRYQIAADGSIFANTLNGLRVSRDGGCSFTTTGPGIYVQALDLASNGEVWIGTVQTGATNDVLRSVDNGMTFQSVGLASPVAFYTSLRVAPSDPKRVYVTSNQYAGMASDAGQTPPEMHFLRSDNSGGMWTTEPLSGVVGAATPELLVAAVDPNNPDVLFIVSIGANQGIGDRLYRSDDGGATFTDVLETTSMIRDVVVVDATHVIVQTAIVSEATMSESGGPAYLSTNGGMAFTPMSNVPQLDCLGLAPDGSLIGCGANWGPDFMAVAKSTDIGGTWSKVWRFVNMAGPLTCSTGTAEQDTCSTQWSGIQMQFAPTGPGCNQPDAGTMMPKKSGGGCCDAGGGAPIGLAWAAALALWLGRRRARLQK